MGLGGKFEANVGDFIRLKGKTKAKRKRPERFIEAGGYVTEIDSTSVKLSLEHPSRKTPFRCKAGFFAEDCLYYLEHFDSYEVIPEKQEN